MQIIHGARGRLTTRFGEDIGRGFPHRGIDIGHGNGTPDDLAVVAPAGGKISAVGRDGTYGYRIIIDHGGGWTSLLAHLAAWTVHEGDEVHQGDLIATMGNTGTVYVHLHQELRFRGAVVDPELYLAESDDMFSDDDRKLLRDLSSRLEAVEKFQRDTLKKDHDNIGAHITREVDRIAGVLGKIITREGKGARAYVANDTGECIVVSTLGKWWLPVSTDTAEGTVNILEDRGWCQPWADRKRLDRPAFDQAMRFYDRLNPAAFDADLGGVTA